MFGGIVYVIICGVVAAVLSTALVMVRPIHEKGESKPWKTYVWVLMVVLAAPYVYGQALTSMFGKDMEKAIQKGYAAANCSGKLKYFRLTSVQKKSASALVVGTDQTDWGGEDSPIISVKLIKKADGSWKPDSFNILTSGKLNHDNIVLPPYW